MNPADASTAGVSVANDEVVRKSKIFVMTREQALSNHAQRGPGVLRAGRDRRSRWKPAAGRRRSEQNLERRAQASLSVVESVEGFLRLFLGLSSLLEPVRLRAMPLKRRCGVRRRDQTLRTQAKPRGGPDDQHRGRDPPFRGSGRCRGVGRGADRRGSGSRLDSVRTPAGHLLGRRLSRVAELPR